LNYGVESIFYSYIISAGITFVTGLMLTKNYLTLKISFSKIKEMLAFGNKFMFIGFFILFIDVSDRFFLKYFFDESIVGIYSANYRLASVMSFLIASFKFSWTPYFLNLNSNPENKKIISSIFTNYAFAGLLLFLIFSVFTELLVKISFFGIEFLDAGYWEGLKIIPVILLAYFFSGAFSILNAAPFFTDNTKSILYITLTGVITNILFNFILIPALDITGAALSTLITYLTMFIAIYLYSQKIYKIDYEWNKILKLILITAISFAIGYFIINVMDISLVLKLVLNSLLIIIYLLIINSLKITGLKKVSMLWKK
jgi:O-antigen/teichoic acid export membrane protein